MAKKYAFFTLKDEEEVDRWTEAWEKYLESRGWTDIYGSGREWEETVATYPDLIESYRALAHGIDADDEQYVVIRKAEFIRAKKIGALPERLMGKKWENMPEGYKVQYRTSKREIIPGVFEEVQSMSPMGIKRDPLGLYNPIVSGTEHLLALYDLEGDEPRGPIAQAIRRHRGRWPESKKEWMDQGSPPLDVISGKIKGEKGKKEKPEVSQSFADTQKMMRELPEPGDMELMLYPAEYAYSKRLKGRW